MAELQTQFGMIPLQCIQISPNQPRKTFDPVKLQELANSVAEVGVIQPILLRTIPDSDTMLELVAGERRYRASTMAGKTEIPGIVKQLTDQQVASIQLIENLQRDGVHPLEEAAGIQRLVDEFNMSVKAICKELGITREYAYARLKLLELAPAARPPFIEGKLSASTALLIARMPVAALQEKVVAEILHNNGSVDPMSHRRAKELIEHRYTLDLTEAVFDTNDAKLVKACGSCATCPKRTGNQPEIYSDISADVCTDPDCFEGKTKAQHEQVVTLAKKRKLPVFADFDEYDASGLSKNHSDVEQPMDNFDRIKEGVQDWKTVEELLPTEIRPEPVGYFLDAGGAPKAIFEDGALQAALEKAGLAHSQEEAARLEAEAKEKPASNSTPTAPRKNSFELRRERLDPVAAKETEYRHDVYQQLRAAAPSDMDLLRCVAKIVVRDNHLTHKLAGQRDYPGDESDRAELIEHSDQGTILRMMLDFLVGTVLDVDWYDIEEKTGVAEENQDFDDLLKVAASASVDATAIRVKHFLSGADKGDDTPTEAPAPTAAPVKAKGKKATTADKPLNPAAAWPFPTGSVK